MKYMKRSIYSTLYEYGAEESSYGHSVLIHKHMEDHMFFLKRNHNIHYQILCA